MLGKQSRIMLVFVKACQRTPVCSHSTKDFNSTEVTSWSGRVVYPRSFADARLIR